ncbi:MAG: DUF308 domain-containing protein [Clostridia bacterium]|nr:DUF308 domain-containing protein [Clostridia bacterium]
MTVFTIVNVIMGILMIIGGISLMATPLITFLSTGYYIIILFFIAGIVGIVQGIADKRFGTEFFFAILSLILGILGMVMPGVAEMNSFMILHMAACWFFVHGIMTIVATIQSRKYGLSTGSMVIGILLGVLDLIMGVYSMAHPAVLAVSLGILIGIYFIESGVNMIFLGTVLSNAVRTRNF